VRKHELKRALIINFRWIRCAFSFLLLIQLLPCSMLAQTESEAQLPDAPVVQGMAETPPTGNISGTVVDKDGAFISKAKITLALQKSGTGSNTRETLSDDSGQFSFSNIAPGPFELTVTAHEFATQKKSGVLQPGQNYVLPQIDLVVATEIDVQVTETQVEVAEEQIHVEEKQRVLGFIPNFYTTYVPDAAPLNTRQKFQLAWKATFDPMEVGIAAFIAGLEQAHDSFSGYGQGAQGYAKRFGATYADFISGTFIGGALLPSLLKQDPRYFYKGTGSKKSRFLYALGNGIICKSDNGRWQPNYSSMLGALAAGGISNLYYPAASRSGIGLTFENAAIGIGGKALGGVVQEFVARRFTPHARDSSVSEK